MGSRLTKRMRTLHQVKNLSSIESPFGEVRHQAVRCQGDDCDM